MAHSVHELSWLWQGVGGLWEGTVCVRGCLYIQIISDWSTYESPELVKSPYRNNLSLNPD